MYFYGILALDDTSVFKIIFPDTYTCGLKGHVCKLFIIAGFFLRVLRIRNIDTEGNKLFTVRFVVGIFAVLTNPDIFPVFFPKPVFTYEFFLMVKLAAHGLLCFIHLIQADEIRPFAVHASDQFGGSPITEMAGQGFADIVNRVAGRVTDAQGASAELAVNQVQEFALEGIVVCVADSIVRKDIIDPQTDNSRI